MTIILIVFIEFFITFAFFNNKQYPFLICLKTIRLYLLKWKTNFMIFYFSCSFIFQGPLEIVSHRINAKLLDKS